MKLVLTSSDIKQKTILKQVLELVGKPKKDISVALIIDACAVETGDKKWLFNGIHFLTKTFGGEIDLINLLALDINEIKQRIIKADIIYCFGGNTEWLFKVFEKSGFNKLLPKLLETKVWIGSSAGSMILGKMPSTLAQSYIYKIDDFLGVNKYLELVNFSIIPHIFGDFTPSDAFSYCVEESKAQKYPVYVLSDKSAVIVNGNKTYMVGSNCQKLLNGKIIEKI